jgi:hypothetical protein
VKRQPSPFKSFLISPFKQLEAGEFAKKILKIIITKEIPIQEIHCLRKIFSP